MKKFCTSLKGHATNIINYEKKKMLPLTKNKSYQDAPRCYTCGKKFSKQFVKDKNYQKVRDHCHFADRFNVPNDIPVVFHNRSNYDYHFIIKKISKWVQRSI